MTMPEIQTEPSVKVLTVPILMLLVYVVCTFFPVIYIYVPALGEIKIVLLSGIALVITYLLTKGRYKNTGAYRNPILFAWFGFLGTMVMSLEGSYDRALTLSVIESNAKYLVVLLVMIKVVESERRLEFLMMVFAGCGVGMAISTDMNYLVFGTTFQESYRAMALEKGIFGDPNDLAMLFDVTVAFLLYFLVKGRRKLMSGIAMSLVIAAVMFTYSRGGFMGLCAVGIGFLLSVGRRRKSYAFIMIVLAILFWGFAPPDYKERISTIKDEVQVDEATGKYKGRMEAWRTILSQGMNSPILGGGAGCSYYVAGSSMGDWHMAHNSFLQVFAELGSVGVFFFLLFFILPYKSYRGLRMRSAEGMERSLERFRFILLGFASFATTGFFLPQAYSPILYFLTGIALIQTQLMCPSVTSPFAARVRQIHP